MFELRCKSCGSKLSAKTLPQKLVERSCPKCHATGCLELVTSEAPVDAPVVPSPPAAESVAVKKATVDASFWMLAAMVILFGITAYAVFVAVSVQSRLPTIERNLQSVEVQLAQITETLKKQQQAAKDEAAAIARVPEVELPKPKTEAELEADAVAEIVSRMFADDRKRASELYKKIVAAPLTLTVEEAEYALFDFGSQALAVPLSKRLHETMKNGIPNEFQIDEPFSVFPDSYSQYVAMILSAAKQLRLTTQGDIQVLCRRAFKERGLSSLQVDVSDLEAKNGKDSQYVLDEPRLSKMKQEPLLRYLLEDYLLWAIQNGKL